MYLGSANLTGAGLGAKADGKRNFEMGIWTESSSLIDGVLEQFNALWEGRNCGSCRPNERACANRSTSSHLPAALLPKAMTEKPVNRIATAQLASRTPGALAAS